MNFVFAISTDALYKEIYLPVLDDSDFEMVLHAKKFGLKCNLHLQLEVVGGIWRFKKSTDYQVNLQVAAADWRPFEGNPLLPGQIIQIKTQNDAYLAILVWEAPAELRAYRKFRISGDQITIGKKTSHDIALPQSKAISHDHATIHCLRDHAVIDDHSQNGTFVNEKRVYRSTPLKFGDQVCIFGLTIIYLGDILAVSSLDAHVTFNSVHLHTLNSFQPDKTVPLDCPNGISSETIVHISPRTLPKFYEGTETIEGVPAKQYADNRPAWMLVLPSLTMVLPMMFGYSFMGSNMGMGLMISGGSALVGVTWSAINMHYARKKQKEQEHRRLARYEQYLVRRSDHIRFQFDHNRQALLDLYPDTITCAQYHAGSANIWARKKQQSDFLFVRLGVGEAPFQVDIRVPVDRFTLEDDELAERPGKIARAYQIMREVPLGISLREHNIVGILTGHQKQKAYELCRAIVTQIVANHSYTDVKLAFVYDGSGENADQWSAIRWFPHVWNEERSMRYIASNRTEANELFYSLGQILRNRFERLGNSIDKTEFYPHYILFIEYPEILEAQMITKYLYDNAKNVGITVVILADDYESLPSACDFVVENTSDFQGIYAVQEGGDTHQEVRFDHMPLELMNDMARRMSSMRVKQIESSSDIPNSLTFFDMMGINQLQELNVLEHWRKNRTYESMRALIGQKAGGQGCYLDINEKYHGPHGLVAGTTGSGKSETLQTYILSLCINFSPLDVGLFIIDFKGGGMANLFSNLPHTIGQISNLSGNQVRRAMVSIKSENKRRQRIFSQFGVNHIDAYTKLFKNREATEPIPHLLIVIDEFAELKREEPEFMKELISVAQVGRSLGVHLILATQKPSGTVDDNIWSNTKFKLCLRVADRQDSNDMLHKPDAAFLTQAGRCFLQVGNDEVFELFQSGWSGATYDESGESIHSGAVLIDLQGKETMTSSKIKGERKNRTMQRWIQKIVSCVYLVQSEFAVPIQLIKCNVEKRQAFSVRVVNYLNNVEDIYSDSPANLSKIEDIIALWPDDGESVEDVAEKLIKRFREQGKTLPEPKEKTQLNAVVSYLAEIAKKNGYENHQTLWMPLLPQILYLTDLTGYAENVFKNGSWKQHEKEFQLSTLIGLVDDPENQVQYPVSVDFAQRGHLAVVGGVTSGKSTFLQTMCYGLISTYSPAELNVYAIDFSSQMLSAFEEDAHFGGVILEGEEDRLNKFFGMISDLLKARKQRVRGGSFSQYIRLHGYVMPAILIVIDGYANFREKTEGRFDDILIELSRTAESYGIYLSISCAGFGSGELQSKIGDNMRQSICLELGDKFRYSEALRTMHFDVLPEENIKGRGLAIVDGNVLEYQTAVTCKAENDYARSEWIREQCKIMSQHWTGNKATPIPEIPKNPTWELYSGLAQYREMVHKGIYLPVAYYQENASLYSIDLSKTFCYLILGRERCGKSVFMRNLACAAKDVGGKIYLIDTENGTDKRTAELVDAEYAATPQAIFSIIKQIILLVNERAPFRKSMIEVGIEDEDIYKAIREKYPPVYLFIADMKNFINNIYAQLPGIGKLNSWIEEIFAKGRLLNVFIFAALNSADISTVSARAAYLNFIKEKNGVVLGGDLSKQNVFRYSNIRYNEIDSHFKPGMGYAMNQEDGQSVDLIVVPQNKGLAKA